MKYLFLLITFFATAVHGQDSIYCIDESNLNFSDFDQLNTDIANSRLILIGETHGVAMDAFIQTDFLIYLNRKSGTRNLLIEFGQSEAYLYNQYLTTGRKEYLTKTKVGYFQWKEAIDSWNRLYEYNEQLPENKKIHVTGLDFEREPALTASLYYLLIPDQDNPNIKEFFSMINSRYDTIGAWNDNKEYILMLRQELSKIPVTELTNREKIEEIVYNNSFYSNYFDRDKFMVKTFLRYDTTGNSYFGQFGCGHTQLDKQKWFAGYLNHMNKYKGKILVINLHYENSFGLNEEPVKYSFINDIGFFNNRTINYNLAYFRHLSGCHAFLYKIEPSNKYLRELSRKCHYVFYLKDQHGYTKIK